MSKALPKSGSACTRVQVSNTRLRPVPLRTKGPMTTLCPFTNRTGGQMSGKFIKVLATASLLIAGLGTAIPASAAGTKTVRYSGATALPNPAAEKLAQCTASTEIYKWYWTEHRRDNPALGNSVRQLLAVWRSMALDYQTSRPRNGVTFGDFVARTGTLTAAYKNKKLGDIPDMAGCMTYFQNDPRIAPLMPR